MCRIQKRAGAVLRNPYWLLSRPHRLTALRTTGGKRTRVWVSHSFELQEELLNISAQNGRKSVVFSPKEKWQEDRAKENTDMEELLPLKPWGLALPQSLWPTSELTLLASSVSGTPGSEAPSYISVYGQFI